MTYPPSLSSCKHSSIVTWDTMHLRAYHSPAYYVGIIFMDHHREEPYLRHHMWTTAKVNCISPTCCSLGTLGRIATRISKLWIFRAYGLQWHAFATFFSQRLLVTSTQSFVDTFGAVLQLMNPRRSFHCSKDLVNSE